MTSSTKLKAQGLYKILIHTLEGSLSRAGCSRQPQFDPHNCFVNVGSLQSMCLTNPLECHTQKAVGNV